MTPKLCASAILMALLAAPVFAASSPAGGARVVTIGLVYDGTWEREAEVTALVQKEISDLIGREFDVRFPPEKVGRGEWTVESIATALDRAIADDGIDLVITLGPLSSLDAVGRRSLPRPVVAGVVPELGTALPLVDGASGVENLSYVTARWTFDRDLNLFGDVTRFSQISVLVPALFLERTPEIRDKLAASATAWGMAVAVVPVGSDAASALDALPPQTEAVFVAPLIHLPASELRTLAQGLIERRLPSWARAGRPYVEMGFLAGAAPAADAERRARRLALNVQRILLGEDAGTLPVRFSEGQRLVINMATARSIKRLPRWGVLNEAELLNQRRPAKERRIGLLDAMREAMEVNLDLEVVDQQFIAGDEKVQQTRAGLLPHLEASALGRVIDEDRAESSLGNAPERQVSASATLTQIIYADGLWARHTAEQHLQRERLHGRTQKRLDVALEAARGFLGVLRAKTFERIQRQNLRRTRQNLELARVRYDIGQAGPGEVYRWENEIANGRKAVIDAKATRHVAELAFNRVLHRPLEESFATFETSVDDPALLVHHEVMFAYLDDPWSFNVFRDFLTREGLDNSPELDRLDAAIDARRRILTSQQRQYWTPTVALKAEIGRVLHEGGAGTKGGLPIEIPAGAMLPFEINTPAEPDDTTWTVGMNVSLPLYDGGGRYAAEREAAAEVARLESERMAAAERIELGVRSSLQRVGASFAGIHLASEAAEASQKNLDTVTDAYGRGAVSIIELIDAQNAALLGELAAASAVYDFMIDMMSAQRAVGRFDLFASDAQRAAFMQRLETWFAKARKAWEAEPEPAPADERTSR